jgi:hypothetical protein
LSYFFFFIKNPPAGVTQKDLQSHGGFIQKGKKEAIMGNFLADAFTNRTGSITSRLERLLQIGVLHWWKPAHQIIPKVMLNTFFAILLKKDWKDMNRHLLRRGNFIIPIP